MNDNNAATKGCLTLLGVLIASLAIWAIIITIVWRIIAW